jgi:antitoxin HicB
MIKKIKAVKPPYPFEAYAHIISPLSQEEGGGYLITLPDIPGCMSDGETPEEAVINGKDAFESCIAAFVDMGRPIPKPSYSPVSTEIKVSGRFIQRVPKTVHAKLAQRAKIEGVSVNTLVLSYISEGLGKDKTA